MERFDIVDKYGAPTGRTAEKGAKLSAGEFYIGAHAYLYNSKNEFLLQRRALNKEFRPGGWDIHMGHVIAGETSAACMARELEEEIGLCVDERDLCLAGRIIWEEKHHLIDVFFYQCDMEASALKLRQDEVIGAAYVSEEEMITLVKSMDYRPAAYRDMVLAYMEQLKS